MPLNIYFELADAPIKDTKDVKVRTKEVKIMNNGNQIGRIFTPSGTSKDVPNAIQVCGFDDAFEFMGCGVFGESIDDGKRPKKDIQLLFSENSAFGNVDYDFENSCNNCFYDKKECKCYDLKVKNKKELLIKELENN